MPNVDMVKRCHTLSVESQLQGKRLRWPGHVFRMPNNELPKKLLFGEVKGLRALALVSMMLHCMIAENVELVDRIELCRTDCCGKTRLVPHVPSPS